MAGEFSSRVCRSPSFQPPPEFLRSVKSVQIRVRLNNLFQHKLFEVRFEV